MVLMWTLRRSAIVRIIPWMSAKKIAKGRNAAPSKYNIVGGITNVTGNEY